MSGGCGNESARERGSADRAVPEARWGSERGDSARRGGERRGSNELVDFRIIRLLRFLCSSRIDGG